MTRIMLHIGHHKTGTSFIQSSFALSVESLAEKGILYPDDPSFARAKKGETTAGNRRSLLLGPDKFFTELEDSLKTRPNCGTALYSGESLFAAIHRDWSIVDMMKQKASVGLLLFVRNPFEAAVSMYWQMIKRGGYMDDLESFLASYDQPELVGEFLNRAQSSGVDVTVLNYSKHRTELLSVVEEWLEVPSGTLVVPPVMVVNRSLTRTEGLFQTAFTRHLGRASSRFISDALCQRLPHVDTQVPSCTEAAVSKFLERVNRQAGAANALIPESEKYDLQSVEDVRHQFFSDPEENYALSKDQIRVLVESLSAEIVRSRRLRAPADADEVSDAGGKALTRKTRRLAVRSAENAEASAVSGEADKAASGKGPGRKKAMNRQSRQLRNAVQ